MKVEVRPEAKQTLSFFASLDNVTKLINSVLQLESLAWSQVLPSE